MVSLTAAATEGSYEKTLHVIELLTAALRKLNARFCRAACKDEPPLTDEEIALAQEAHAIFLGDSSHGAPTLKLL